MKKSTIIIALVATVFNFSAAKADSFNNDANANTDNINITLDNNNIASVDSLISNTIGIDSVASTFCKNMTEKDVTKMNKFMSNPDYIATQERVTKALSDSTSEYRQEMQMAVLSMLSGQTPKDFEAVNCPASYKKSFDRYWEMNQGNVLNRTFNLVQKCIPDDDPEAKAFANTLISYLKNNMKTVYLKIAYEKVKKADLDKLNSIAKKSFYSGMQKAKNDLMDKTMEKITSEMQSED